MSAQPASAPRIQGAHDHLLAELRRLDLLLHRQVLRARAAESVTEDSFRGLRITDEQVDAILAERQKGRPEQSAHQLAIVAAQHRALIQREEALAEEQGTMLPLAHLDAAFALTPVERDFLLLAIAPELDASYSTLFGFLQGNREKRPTVDLLARLLTESPIERLALLQRLAPDATLLRSMLVRLEGDDDPLPCRRAAGEPRIARYLLGDTGLDPALGDCAQLTDLAAAGPDPLVEELRGACGAHVVLQGSGLDRCRELAARWCGSRKFRLLRVDARRISSEEAFLAAAAALRREAVLQRACIVIDHAGRFAGLPGWTERVLPAAAERMSLADRPVFWISDDSLAFESRTSRFYRIAVPAPRYSERLAAWREALAAVRAPRSLEPAPLAARFLLDRDAVARAVTHAAAASDGKLKLTHLENAALHYSGDGLNTLAQHVPASFGWDDLVLPARVHNQLREICRAALHRHAVHTDWGFEATIGPARGLNAMFSGPSGTGKTMAASIVAREIGLPMYRIDLSGVVSKYIGETEKNLRRMFQAARDANVVLFFDEADALFGKRSEVRDSHDRYANLDVAYLLQRIEDYEGVVILATNFSSNLDDAFLRRLGYVVEFPQPDQAQRRMLWRRMIPAAAPLGKDVDFDFLAEKFELAGGHIRNAVLAAALDAANSRRPIGMAHLVFATARELRKLGKLPSKAAFGEYAALLKDS